jgi:hypothetical protein
MEATFNVYFFVVLDCLEPKLWFVDGLMLFTLVFSVHVNQLDSKHVLHMLEPFVIVLPFTVRDWLGGTPRPTQRDGWRTQSICGQKGH